MRTLQPNSKADLVVHPLRLRIITELAGLELSPRQIAERMPEVSQATLYRQIRKLEQGGMLRVSDRRPVRGVEERFYALIPGATRLTREEFSSMSAEEHEQSYAILMGTISGQLSRYARQPDADLTRDGMTYFSSVLELTDEQARQFRLEMIALIERFSADKADAGGMRRFVGVASIPETQESREQREALKTVSEKGKC